MTLAVLTGVPHTVWAADPSGHGHSQAGAGEAEAEVMAAQLVVDIVTDASKACQWLQEGRPGCR